MRWLAIGCVLLWGAAAAAHPMVEHALEVVIAPDRVTITARIAVEELRLVEGATRPIEEAARAHGAYVARHLRVRADGVEIAPGRLIETLPFKASDALAGYRVEFALARPRPAIVRIDQDFLREFDAWGASCVVSVRQSNEAEAQTALLRRDNSVEYGCEWPAAGTAATTRAAGPVRVTARVGFWRTLGSYLSLGVRHILNTRAWDHLLFAAALVLAIRRLWDLVAVVTVFTAAHSLTLTLSVLNLLHLSARIVEPMIAASIVVVAVLNIFWAEPVTRRWRLSAAFAFGLFHGLGFAGDLSNAMAGLPALALAAALIGFSVGVEVGQQVVVLPLFGALNGIRRFSARGSRSPTSPSPTPFHSVSDYIVRIGSSGITAAGVYFLIQAIL